HAAHAGGGRPHRRRRRSRGSRTPARAVLWGIIWFQSNSLIVTAEGCRGATGRERLSSGWPRAGGRIPLRHPEPARAHRVVGGAGSVPRLFDLIPARSRATLLETDSKPTQEPIRCP